MLDQWRQRSRSISRKSGFDQRHDFFCDGATISLGLFLQAGMQRFRQILDYQGAHESLDEFALQIALYQKATF